MSLNWNNGYTKLEADFLRIVRIIGKIKSIICQGLMADIRNNAPSLGTRPLILPLSFPVACGGGYNAPNDELMIVRAEHFCGL